MEMFLFGYAFCTLQKVQDYLAQGMNKEALSHINDSMRHLNSEMNKFYNHPVVEVESKL